jgi:RimJ/RimL family protein N-acetyltransferase
VSGVTIELSVGGVVLRPLESRDAADYCPLVRRNASYLGPDWADDVQASEADQARSFDANPDPPMMFAIVAGGVLIGRIDLVPVDPPRFGLGYWVSQEHSGNGIATSAVGAVVAYARHALAAADVYAGVSHGNTASERVLARNGFKRVARFDTYDRFQRTLAELQ